MEQNNYEQPDRQISNWKKPVRYIIRRLRYLKYKIILNKRSDIASTTIFGKSLEIRPPEYIKIGKNVYIGPWFVVETNLEIGPDVLISSRVACIGNDHNFKNPKKTIIDSGRLRPSKIVIEGDNLIGFGSIIIGNVNIGKGVIVAAGSVVTKNLEPYWIYGGIPAKKIKQRFAIDD